MDEKIRAAYALNLWTVSVAQIVDYNDVYVLQQEYDNIMNNLNLEHMPKDEALLDIIQQILDQITYLRMDEGDKAMLEKRYQHQLKNAVWSAVPNIGAIFATHDPVALGLTLATEVGIGYMNYRRKKGEYQLGYEESQWEIQKNHMQHLHALQRELFRTAWRMADEYQFPDEYRLNQKQITEYNQALVESNILKRYNMLDGMKSKFTAYPAFWYHIGSTANSIYRGDMFSDDPAIRIYYKSKAIEGFEKFEELNRFNLLRHDVLAASWALEYLELLDLNHDNGADSAKKLIKIAENHAGNAQDVLELCAFAYLRVRDEENAARILHALVNKGYNSAINTQLLSGLYIKQMLEGKPNKVFEAKVRYRQLPIIADPKYILEMPADDIDMRDWKPIWNREEEPENLFEHSRKKAQERAERQNKARERAREFYQKPILLVNNSETKNVSEFFLGILNDYRAKIDPSLPYPSQCELKEYRAKREEIERQGTHVILLGDSAEAKKLYKNAKSGCWDYYNLGMGFVSHGNKTVLLARNLKNKQINDLISIAKETAKKYSIKIPSGVETIKPTFLQETLIDTFEESPLIGILAGITGAPLLIAGSLVEGVFNGIQFGTNVMKRQEMEYLQYYVLMYTYLEEQKAIID